MVRGDGVLASVPHLENITSAPDREGENDHDDPSQLCSCSPSDIGKVQGKAEDESSKDLSQPIKRVVECTSTRAELHEVDVLELICVKPIGGKEHWKKEYHVGITPKSFPQADDLRLPRWVLHQNYFGPITTHHVLSINQCPRQTSSKKREDQKANIGAVADGVVVCTVNVQAELNLVSASASCA